MTTITIPFIVHVTVPEGTSVADAQATLDAVTKCGVQDAKFAYNNQSAPFYDPPMKAIVPDLSVSASSPATAK